MKIGNNVFKYKKDALKFYRDILNSYKPLQIVNRKDFNDLVELIKMRPDKDKKIGCGIQIIHVVEVRYKTKCFELIRKDGSKSVFSYIKCINGKSTQIVKFSKTCRETITDDLRDVKLAYFKKNSSKGQVKCQESGKLCKWEELNVDHRQPNTFSVIVDRFIEVCDIDINTVEYTEVMDGVYNFSNNELAEKFRNYHKNKANLRLVMKKINSSRSHQAKIQRQKKDLTVD